MSISKHIEEHAILGIKQVKSLNDIPDVSVEQSSTGQILQYNGSEWVPSSPMSVSSDGDWIISGQDLVQGVPGKVIVGTPVVGSEAKFNVNGTSNFYGTLKIEVPPEAPPLIINSPQKIDNLNADKLDGKDSDFFSPINHVHENYLEKNDNLSSLSNKQEALNNLTNSFQGYPGYVLTIDTSTGNAVWKQSSGGNGGDVGTYNSIIASTGIINSITTNNISSSNKIFINNQVIGKEFVKAISGEVNRNNGYISQINITNGRTLIISRSGGYISSIYDGERTWTFNRNEQNHITSWQVT